MERMDLREKADSAVQQKIARVWWYPANAHIEIRTGAKYFFVYVVRN